MQHVTRLTLHLLLATTLGGSVLAAETPKAEAKPAVKDGPKPVLKEEEYKRSDTNYYWKGDVLKVDPGAVIILAGRYTQKGDSYFFTPKVRAPKEMYVEVMNDWIEPITPPDMPVSLGVPPAEMQIREPQGDVQVAFPSAPTNFLPATAGMTVPDGAVVKTGANGTAAVVFGGVDSARLIPNTEAAVQQTVTELSRSVEVDLTKGAIFSKVGQRIGEKEDYQVHTSFGVAAARGTDFVSVAMPARVDVWIAHGTVQLNSPDGKTVGTVKSDDSGALKIVRYPVMNDMHQAMMASAETMTAAMNFIPMVNMKIKGLRDKMSQGAKLTANELDYLGRIKQVPCLVKLTLVEPVTALTPRAPTPVIAPVPAPSKPLSPITFVVHADGKVKYDTSLLSIDELKPKLIEMAKDTPEQPIIIKAQAKATADQIKALTDLCAAAPLKNVTAPKAAAAAPAPAPIPPPAPAPAPAPAPEKPATTAATSPPKFEVLTLTVHNDGKVKLLKDTLTLDELKPKLADIAKSTPDQPIVIKAGRKATPEQLKAVADLCAAAPLKNVTVSAPTAPSASATTPPQTYAPVPAPAPAPAKTPEVTPPTPAKPEPAKPVAVEKPAAKPAKLEAPKPAAPAKPAAISAAASSPARPIEITVRTDGKIDYVQGGNSHTLSLDELATKLQAVAKSTPDVPVTIKATKDVPYERLADVIKTCADSQLKSVTVAKPEEAPPTPPAVPTAAKSPAPTPVASANSEPADLYVRPDGKFDFQGDTLSSDDLKSKFENISKTTPGQVIVLKGGDKADKEQLDKLREIVSATNVKVKGLRIARATPPPALPAPVESVTPPVPASSGGAMPPSVISTPASSAPSATAPLPPVMQLP